jgi:two-component system chemotaxis response regulator CheB
MHTTGTSGPVVARRLIVLAASAGGLDALRTICSALPLDLPAAVAIVQHRSRAHSHLLAVLLGQWSALPVKDAETGDQLVHGTILIAPPERHMTVSASRHVVLLPGPPIHHVLSSADPLFESAAEAFGPNLTAVVLTGHDGDGSDGVRAVRRRGGRVIAQDPATAFRGSMPQSSIDTGMVDQILTLEQIAAELAALGHTEAGTAPAVLLDAPPERPTSFS